MSGGLHTLRKSERLRVTLFASCAPRDQPVEADSAPARARDVVLVNITPEGCCMTVREDAAPPVGSAVLIRLVTGDALLGTIRWVRSGQAGVLFDIAIGRARVDQLRREHSTFLSEIDVAERPAQRSVV